MTRQIKFRAWEIDWKNNDQKQGRMIQWEDIRDDFAQITAKTSHFILMQFTGLLDKNGKEIYEGDIVEFPITKGRHIIEYIESDARYSCPGAVNAEVIGNIYENPELLPPTNKSL